MNVIGASLLSIMETFALNIFSADEASVAKGNISQS